jgi:hypothetical protein
MKRFVGLLVSCFLVPATGSAQGRSIDLGIAKTGISLGNSPVWNGLRLNWRDADVDRVSGLNLTLWRAGANPDFDMNGIALGLLGPDAARIRGLALGAGGVVSHDATYGIALAGLGVVSNGDLIGLSMAGLAVVSESRSIGIQMAGLAVVSEGGLYGINMAGLATVSSGSMRGFNAAGLGLVGSRGVAGLNLAGLAVVSNGTLTGLTAGGLAVVADGDIRGITSGGLAVVSEGHIRGIATAGLAVVTANGLTGAALSGLAIVSSGGPVSGAALTLGRVQADTLRGIMFGGYRVTARDARGFVSSIGWNDLQDVTGLSIAAYNRARGTQRGVAIGLFNNAEALRGIQIGLLNRAGNNPGIARMLPILNVHFD